MRRTAMLLAAVFAWSGCHKNKDSDTEVPSTDDTDTTVDTDDTDVTEDTDSSEGEDLNEATDELADLGFGQAISSLHAVFDDTLSFLDEEDFRSVIDCPTRESLGFSEWELTYGEGGQGCRSTLTGMWGAGVVNIERGIGLEWTVDFDDHRRGPSVVGPTWNGKLFFERADLTDYTISNVDGEPLTLDVHGGGDFEVTIETPIEVAYSLSGGTWINAGSLKFERESTHTVTVTEALNYPRDSECTCPATGQIQTSLTLGDGADSPTGTLAINYDADETECGANNLTFTYTDDEGNEQTRDVPMTDTVGFPTDLRAIDSLCITSRRDYSCPVMDPKDWEDPSTCASYAGVYHVYANSAAYTVSGGDGEPITDWYLAGTQPDAPGHLCHELIMAQRSELEQRAYRIEILDNCQVFIAEGRPGADSPPRALCAGLRLINGKLALRNEDLPRDDDEGDFHLGQLFGVDEDDVSLTINDGVLSITVQEPASDALAGACRDIAEADDDLADLLGRNECLHDWHLEPDDIWVNEVLDINDDFGAIWDTLDANAFDCPDAVIDELKAKIADWDEPDADNGIDEGWYVAGNDITSEVYGEKLISILGDQPDGEVGGFLGMLESMPAFDPRDLTQTFVFSSNPYGENLDVSLPDDLPEDEQYWPEMNGGPFEGNRLDELLNMERRVYYVALGHLSLDVPDAQDLEDTCDLVEQACEPFQGGVRFGVYQSDFEKTCDVLVGSLSRPLDGLCDKIDAGLTLWNNNRYSVWTDFTGIEGDELPQAMDLDGTRGLLNQLVESDIFGGLASGYKDKDLSFARVFIVDDGLPDNLDQISVTVVAPGENDTLVPQEDLAQATLNEVLDKIVIDELGFVDNDNAAAWAANSLVDHGDDGHFRYQQNQLHTVTLDSDDWSDPVSVEIETPTLIEVCHPNGWMLDNVYSPAFRWNGTYDIVPDLPLENGVINASLTRSDLEARIRGLNAGNNLTNPNLVLQYYSAFDPLGMSMIDPSNDPASMHGSLWRVVPDMGLFTMQQKAWWTVAPTGRNYMHTPQEVLDYTLSVTSIRANHKVLFAEDLYGPDPEELREEDVAVVVGYSIDLKLNFVINSDLFPEGNSTHFFRRDLLGSLLALAGVAECPDPEDPVD